MSDYTEESKLNLFYVEFFQTFEGFVPCLSSISVGRTGICYHISTESQRSLLIQQSMSNYKLLTNLSSISGANTLGWDSSVQRTLLHKSCLLSALSFKHQPSLPVQRAKVSSFSPPMKNLLQTLKTCCSHHFRGSGDTPPASCCRFDAWTVRPEHEGCWFESPRLIVSLVEVPISS